MIEKQYRIGNFVWNEKKKSVHVIQKEDFAKDLPKYKPIILNKEWSAQLGFTPPKSNILIRQLIMANYAFQLNEKGNVALYVLPQGAKQHVLIRAWKGMTVHGFQNLAFYLLDMDIELRIKTNKNQKEIN